LYERNGRTLREKEEVNRKVMAIRQKKWERGERKRRGKK
jgi:hypothetical protein